MLTNKAGTGFEDLDRVIDLLRLGDNVVWQIDGIEDYRVFVDAFVKQSVLDKRKVVYIRFGRHDPLVCPGDGIKIYEPDSKKGFESFTKQVYGIITKEGRYAFYVFDCLTDLLDEWCSDLMIGNFFKITCPYLFTLDTVAYFALERNRHSYDCIARIRETTQLLLDLKNISDTIYLQPLKVSERYSSTMFLPHRFEGEKFITVTSSVDASTLFEPSLSHDIGGRLDYWDKLFLEAFESISENEDEDEKKKILERLIGILIGKKGKIFALANKFFAFEDIMRIKERQIGTGYIGGKSVGMLIARKILEKSGSHDFEKHFEPHDSYYLGSDIFYTYLVQNGWWNLRMEQIQPEGYFEKAAVLKEKMLNGKFPANIKENFMEMLEYFGQSPIIVRSSSLLEDNFGNAFAGKYESVFCVNRGSPEQRYEQFEDAVRRVYASTMGEDALNYRLKRNLADNDEQMALLVQRVSGDYHGKYFFPTLAGVGNSSNLYVWDKEIDPDAGMLRLVFGLGTRAVDRVSEDYPRIVSLDKPLLRPVSQEEIGQYSQHFVDLLNLEENCVSAELFSDLVNTNPDMDVSLFAGLDSEAYERMKSTGKTEKKPYILTFDKLLSETGFAEYMRNMLSCLEEKYEYPVDTEFTVNFTKDNKFLVNLLQCRPLQTRGLGKTIQFPEDPDPEKTIFRLNGDFMGGNVRLDIDRIVYVDPGKYAGLSESEKYGLARSLGKINREIGNGDSTAMLVVPGRLGSTTPSMGVPVNFSEISNFAVVCEMEFVSANLAPELSYGSHFFQDLVESEIFYVGIFPDKKGNYCNFEFLEKNEEPSDKGIINMPVTASLFSDVVKGVVLALLS